ncbi:hypothetical protein Hanom_Chr13g01196341 [Helianthus anomalus]
MVSGTGISIRFIKPGVFSVPVWHRFLSTNTGSIPVPTGTEPYRTRYIRYRYPLLVFR